MGVIGVDQVRHMVHTLFFSTLNFISFYLLQQIGSSINRMTTSEVSVLKSRKSHYSNSHYLHEAALWVWNCTSIRRNHMHTYSASQAVIVKCVEKSSFTFRLDEKQDQLMSSFSHLHWILDIQCQFEMIIRNVSSSGNLFSFLKFKMVEQSSFMGFSISFDTQ